MALSKAKTRMITGSIADLSGSLPWTRLSGKINRITREQAEPDLNVALTEIPAFRQEFQVADDGLIYLTASVDIKHRGISISGNTEYPIGIAIRAYVRSATTQGGLAAQSFTQVPMAYSAGNIASLTDHYGHMIFSRVPYGVIAGRWYQFTLYGTSHSSVAPSTDGLAELNAGGGSDYNYFLTEYTPGETFSSNV